MDVIAARPSRRSDQLKLTIEAVRQDQTRLDLLAKTDLNDIVLWITEQPTSGVTGMDLCALVIERPPDLEPAIRQQISSLDFTC